MDYLPEDDQNWKECFDDSRVTLGRFSSRKSQRRRIIRTLTWNRRTSLPWSWSPAMSSICKKNKSRGKSSARMSVWSESDIRVWLLHTARSVVLRAGALHLFTQQPPRWRLTDDGAPEGGSLTGDNHCFKRGRGGRQYTILDTNYVPWIKLFCLAVKCLHSLTLFDFRYL